MVRCVAGGRVGRQVAWPRATLLGREGCSHHRAVPAGPGVLRGCGEEAADVGPGHGRAGGPAPRDRAARTCGCDRSRVRRVRTWDSNAGPAPVRGSFSLPKNWTVLSALQGCCEAEPVPVTPPEPDAAAEPNTIKGVLV